MSSNKRNLRLAGAFATLIIFGVGVGCTGFFVNPTISSLAVGPAAPTIETGSTNNTVQMTVFATNSDGSTANNPSVSWSITPTSTATINSSGLVTSVAVGTATVTAASNQNPSITGTATVTVTVGCITSITLSSYSGAVSANQGTTVDLTASAVTCNGSQDVTDVATWTSSNTSLATVAGGVVSAVAGITSGGTVNVTASIGNISSPPAVITVSP
jgi:trimeric autotransporter adhesin